MAISYEWVIEELDEHDDIQENHFSDTLEGLGDLFNKVDDIQYRLALVRDRYASDGDLVCREYYYTTCPWSIPTNKWVLLGTPPARFHEELKKRQV